MDLLQRTLDLEEERTVVEQQIEEVEDEIDALVDEALELDPPETENEKDRIAQIEQEVAELESKKVSSEGYLKAIDRAIEMWDGTELAIRELSGTETRIVADEAQRKADELGLDNYSENIHETEFMQRAVASTPPGCPDPDNIGDLPNRMFDWVLTRANMLNSVGEFSMGNSSLRERMIERRGTSKDDGETPDQSTSSRPPSSNAD